MKRYRDKLASGTFWADKIKVRHREPAERNLPFELAAAFGFETARIQIDARHDYGEVRYVAIGLIDGRLHVLCFTETPDGIRVISLRKANDREVKHHAKVHSPD